MNAHINKNHSNRKIVKYDRKYLGVTVTAENYRELIALAVAAKLNPRHEINYHTRHLEAYLKGKTSFTHGFKRDKEGKAISPAIFKVMQELTIRD